MFSAIAAALLLAAGGPAQAEGSGRYALDLSVVHAGVQTVAARTVLVEDGSANVTVQDVDGLFEMNASLAPVQGDGDEDSLALSISILDGDAQPVEPNLVIRRGGTARVVIGHEGPDGVMFEGLKVTLTPLPDAD
ncbi:hypothetical protein ACETK8_08240 [Brevundimonas staleyi]|uniref:Uncharacterized protein n=1 Tax=Brevundimonas staleyi TaxID=74326 RepID=A0ABW0FSI2_9CAUL